MAEQFFDSSGEQRTVKDADGLRFPVKSTFDQLSNAGSSFTAAQVTVDTTSGGVLIAALDLARKFLEIRNTGSAIVYWGPTGVTTATGYPLGPGESFTLDAPMNTAAIYGIVASGSVTVATMKW